MNNTNFDCDALRLDIENLKSKHTFLRTQFNNITETGIGKSTYLDNYSKISTAADKSLEKYITSFAEHNPDIFGWRIVKQEKELPEQLKRYFVDTLTTLQNGDIFLGGDECALYRLSVNDAGSIDLVDRVEEFLDENGQKERIYALAPLSNNSVLVGGVGGTIRECRIGEDGKWHFGHIIDNPTSINVYPTAIFSAAALSDREIMVGCGTKDLYEYYKNTSGEWQHTRIDLDASIPNNYSIYSIIPLSRDKVLVDIEASLYECRRDASGNWQTRFLMNGISDSGNLEEDMHYIFEGVSFAVPLSDGTAFVGDYNGNLCQIGEDEHGEWQIISKVKEKFGGNTQVKTPSCATVVSDTEIIVGGQDGAIGQYIKDASGNWSASSYIEGFVNFDDQATNVYHASSVSNKTIVLAGDMGAIQILERPVATVDTLKAHLDQVINKQKSLR